MGRLGLVWAKSPVLPELGGRLWCSEACFHLDYQGGVGMLYMVLTNTSNLERVPAAPHHLVDFYI